MANKSKPTSYAGQGHILIHDLTPHLLKQGYMQG